jgi:hypothetical protein
MANIRFEDPGFSVDVLGQLVTVPYYGNYGGPDSPGILETNKKGEMLNKGQLKADVDILDFFFYVHDFQSTFGDEAVADINLLQSLTYHDQSYHKDPEALLYDALVTIAMVGKLALEGNLSLAPPNLLVDALVDAYDDLIGGVEGLAAENPGELTAILNGLFGQPDAPGVYSFEFVFPTLGGTEIENEVAEALVVSAVAGFINEGGVTDPILIDTITDDAYKLVLSGSDLDLLSA